MSYWKRHAPNLIDQTSAQRSVPGGCLDRYTYGFALGDRDAHRHLRLRLWSTAQDLYALQRCRVGRARYVSTCRLRDIHPLFRSIECSLASGATVGNVGPGAAWFRFDPLAFDGTARGWGMALELDWSRVGVCRLS